MSVKITDRAKEIAQPIAKKHEVELVDVEYLNENGNRILRFYIYKTTGITLDDCEKVHIDINQIIDDAIDITEKYLLEVSSPGYERKFKYDRDFERYMGEKIQVKLYAALNGKKTYEGILKDYKDQVITLETQDGVMIIEKEKTSKVKRVFEMVGG